MQRRPGQSRIRAPCRASAGWYRGVSRSSLLHYYAYSIRTIYIYIHALAGRCRLLPFFVLFIAELCVRYTQQDLDPCIVRGKHTFRKQNDGSSMRSREGCSCCALRWPTQYIRTGVGTKQRQPGAYIYTRSCVWCRYKQAFSLGGGVWHSYIAVLSYTALSCYILQYPFVE